MALELSNQEGKLAFSDGRQTRQVNVAAGDQGRLRGQIAKAKEKFKLPGEAKIYSCYEAGRDGFWIHRMLTEQGVTNLVVDPASIEVNRRARRFKTDRLDAAQWLTMLLRYWMYGEKTLWSVLHVPSVEEEASRRLHRNAERLKKEKRAHQSRLRSLLALHGLKPRKIPAHTWAELKDWKGDPLPAAYVAELQQEQERLDVVKKQLVALAEIRKTRCKVGVEPATQPTSLVPAAERWSVKLAQLRGVGVETAWNLGHEFFGWRKFRNRREVGAAAGWTGSP
jgi:transposase